MITPRLQRASGITITSPSKLALKLADCLEENLLSSGWHPNKVIGPEAAIAVKYNCTARAVRQALRVLEARGFGHMRRGGAGGLVIEVPSQAATGRLLALHLTALGVDAEDIRSAREALLDCLHDESASELVTGLLDPAIEAADFAMSARVKTARNRALAIAQQMAAQNTGNLMGETGSLGTIDDLMDLFSAGRSTIVQALRILEDQELVGPVRGRSGGLRQTHPSPAPIAEAMHAHLLARDVAFHDCELVVHAIGVRSAAAAARGAGPTDAQLGALQYAVAPAIAAGDLSIQITIFSRIVAIAGDVVLHTVARCLWFHQIRQRTLRRPPGPAEASNLGKRLIVMLDAVRAGQPAEASEAMRACQREMADLVNLTGSDFARSAAISESSGPSLSS